MVRQSEKGIVVLVAEVVNKGQEETHFGEGTCDRGLPSYCDTMTCLEFIMTDDINWKVVSLPIDLGHGCACPCQGSPQRMVFCSVLHPSRQHR